jgi:phage tail sheath protein FI
MFRQGAFPGQTPQECYQVRCGPDTMTQSDLDRGDLVVEVGVAPIRPAEFVNIRIRRGRP